MCEFDHDSNASLQSLHGSKFCMSWVVELHIIVKCESLLGGQGKALFTVKEDKLNLIVLCEVMLVASVN